jgi:peptidoglycan/xylan/chitin deacetylase (PgdA/CDA1 family)
MDTGKFVISLDFELMWGVRDKRTIESYGDAIIGVRTAIEQMLLSFEKHGVKATFATVGFLFHKTKKDLLENVPIIKPSYTIEKLSPYPNIEKYLGENEDEDPYYFGHSLIQQIKNRNVHELATHTYCHYYCLEPGQTVAQFENDLKVAIIVAEKNDVTLKSIVFPRNQYNGDYTEVCHECGITSFRGSEKSRIYESSNGEGQTLIKRALRLMDSYINITGYNCHRFDTIKESTPYNIPSSRFLRPYSEKLRLFEGLKFLRIKKAMTHAAKNNLVYHLWWHPHNFGRNCKENICFLEKILKHYDFLNEKYAFQSLTMEELSHKLNSTK